MVISLCRQRKYLVQSTAALSSFAQLSGDFVNIICNCNLVDETCFSINAIFAESFSFRDAGSAHMGVIMPSYLDDLDVD